MSQKLLKFLAFGIDSAERSGIAVARHADRCEFSGVVRTAVQRRDTCERVAALQVKSGLPLVVVAEGWGGVWQRWSTAHGAGRNWGRWLDPIELILGVKEAQIVRVKPQTWRPALFGPELVKGQDSDALKALACAYTGLADKDEAEAICLTFWVQSSVEGQEAAEAYVQRAARATR